MTLSQAGLTTPAPSASDRQGLIASAKEVLSPTGLTTLEYEVLGVLVLSRYGDLTTSTMVGRLELHRSALAATVQTLRARNTVDVLTSASGRAPIVRLRPEGRRVFELATAMLVQRTRRPGGGPVRLGLLLADLGDARLGGD